MENRTNVIQGQSDTQLSDLGRKQASLVGSRLSQEHFTHMYSSDLSRAADTARAIVASNKTSTSQLVIDKRLRERSFGVMEGKSFSELQSMMKDLCLNPQTFTPEKGERVEQVTKRAALFFKDICAMVVNSSSDLMSDKSVPSLEDVRENPLGECSNIDSSALPSDSSVSLNLTEGRDPSTEIYVQTSNGVESKLASTSGSKNVEQNILIVSHGLLIRELKRLILDRFKGNLDRDMTQQNQRISPNTGVSQFTLTACRASKKIRVVCTECHFINCSKHLSFSNQDLVSEAKYQDTV